MGFWVIFTVWCPLVGLGTYLQSESKHRKVHKNDLRNKYDIS